MTLHCSNIEVITVAVVQYLVHGGISKNHCSSGNWPICPMPPSPPPSTAAMIQGTSWKNGSKVREKSWKNAGVWKMQYIGQRIDWLSMGDRSAE